MNFNHAMQNAAKAVFAGAAVASPAIDIRQYVGFSFSFEVIADIAADAVFNVQAAPPSDADNCLPGTFEDVAEVLICSAGAAVVPGTKSLITIPAGTKKGSMCSATLPCRPNAFLKVDAESGDTAKVNVAVVLSGPR